MKDKVPEYGDFPIKRLPPGEAFGARDLTRWAHRRAVGSTGTGSAQARALTVECKSCGAESQIIGSQARPRRARRGIFDCRHCGERDARIVKAKRIKVV
jgi:hypothetical protein